MASGCVVHSRIVYKHVYPVPSTCCTHHDMCLFLTDHTFCASDGAPHNPNDESKISMCTQELKVQGVLWSCPSWANAPVHTSTLWTPHLQVQDMPCITVVVHAVDNILHVASIASSVFKKNS